MASMWSIHSWSTTRSSTTRSTSRMTLGVNSCSFFSYRAAAFFCSSSVTNWGSRSSISEGANRRSPSPMTQPM